MRVIYLSFLIILSLLVILFAVLNSQNIDLNFYLTTVSVPISLALAISLIIGCVLGFLLCLKTIIYEKYQIHCLKKEINTAKKEISNLRSIPIKDNT